MSCFDLRTNLKAFNFPSKTIGHGGVRLGTSNYIILMNALEFPVPWFKEISVGFFILGSALYADLKCQLKLST